jgi:hypothetical protein
LPTTHVIGGIPRLEECDQFVPVLVVEVLARLEQQLDQISRHLALRAAVLVVELLRETAPTVR